MKKAPRSAKKDDPAILYRCESRWLVWSIPCKTARFCIAKVSHFRVEIGFRKRHQLGGNAQAQAGTPQICVPSSRRLAPASGLYAQNPHPHPANQESNFTCTTVMPS
jgi:hypothetical protein